MPVTPLEGAGEAAFDVPNRVPKALFSTLQKRKKL
jgi:hypothetical protein